MFDDVQLGWLGGDDYERKAAADAAAVGELGEYDGTGVPPTLPVGQAENSEPPEGER